MLFYVTDMDNKKELRKEFSHLRAEIRDKVSKDLDITERLLEEEKIESEVSEYEEESHRSDSDFNGPAIMLVWQQYHEE